jgi:hypothetical protein
MWSRTGGDLAMEEKEPFLNTSSERLPQQHLSRLEIIVNLKIQISVHITCEDTQASVGSVENLRRVP